MSKKISLLEVAKHNSAKSLWMVIHGDVYDVTKFLSEHPGGEDTLLEAAGKDATEPFEEVGHSDDAREILKKYKIGTLPPEEKSKCSEACSKLKWGLLLLAAAIIIGITAKKMSS